jgi:hypothetical protein
VAVEEHRRRAPSARPWRLRGRVCPGGPQHPGAKPLTPIRARPCAQRLPGDPLPFRRFARERLVLVLVGLAALSLVHFPNTQDETRLALTQSIAEHGELTIDRYGRPIDRARYEGRLYTDKAPGLSFAALPAVAAVRAFERVAGGRITRVWESPEKLWLVRALVLAPFLALLVWLQGRVAEGLAAATGAVVAVAVGLGTMVGALASILFAHVPATCLVFAAFVVLGRRRGHKAAAVAGALAGTAVLMEYQAAFIAVALGGYALLKLGGGALARYVAGGAPAAVVLGAYNWAAFESPFRLSYDYVDGPNERLQSEGFFGIGWPHLGRVSPTLLGDHGLLVRSPIVIVAAVGLVLLWRRRFRAEAALAGAITALFLLLGLSYFLPLGGLSPGLRFFTPALPFLLLGLPLAFATWPRVVAAILIVSVALSTENALTWFSFSRLPETIWSPGDFPPLPGVLLVCASAGVVTAIAVAALPSTRGRPKPRAGSPP